jgi:DNA replication protein DnaC
LQREQRETAWRHLLATAGSRYGSADFGTFLKSAEPMLAAKQTAALEAVREYASTLRDRAAESEGLILFGPVGTGKDHLAMAVCRRAILELEVSCRWLNGPQWFGSLRDAISDEQSESKTLADLVRPAVLVISDPLPPVGELTTYQAGWLYRVVDRRYSTRGKITIITVNARDDSEADKRMGPATWDRLCHGAWRVRCEWPSFRKAMRNVNC